MNRNKKEPCPTCGHNMAPYLFTFDVADAVLLIAMANEVKARLGAIINLSPYKDFNIANQVHVPSLYGVTHAVKCRTTHASKLGLIAKVRNKDGKHVAGCWLVTTRGWAALRGEPVPAEVVVKNGEITQRGTARVRIDEALRINQDKVRKAAIANKKGPQDYREVREAYNPADWATYGATAVLSEAQGQLF